MHKEIQERIDYKLNFVKVHKPKWYGDDEDRLRGVEAHIDNQIKRIGRKTQQKGYKPPFHLDLPEGMKEAERGR
jgi:hypothetical protein